MKNDIFNDLTIVLKVRDNHKMTNRWLSNALNQKVKFKILIADGGMKTLNINHQFNNGLILEHVKTAYDKDHLTYMRKLSYVLNEKVTTKFSLIADDDDFYIFSEIEKYVNFLLNNNDYVACCGSILKFELKEKYKGNPIFTTISKLKDFTNEKPIERLFQILQTNNYREVYYDVMHTKIIGKAFNDFIEINSNNVNYRFVEFYILIKVLSAGKIKSFDDVSLLRQEDYQSSTSTGILSTMESIFMQNWSVNYFNMLNYSFLEFKIDKNNIDQKELIINKFKKLFEQHVANEIINGGRYKISLLALIRGNIKSYVYFNLLKNFKKSIKLYFFYLANFNILNKIKKIIF